MWFFTNKAHIPQATLRAHTLFPYLAAGHKFLVAKSLRILGIAKLLGEKNPSALNPCWPKIWTRNKALSNLNHSNLKFVLHITSLPDQFPASITVTTWQQLFFKLLTALLSIALSVWGNKSCVTSQILLTTFSFYFWSCPHSYQITPSFGNLDEITLCSTRDLSSRVGMQSESIKIKSSPWSLINR